MLFSPTIIKRETHRAIISLYVKQAFTHSNIYTHNIHLPFWITYTPTYVAAVLADWERGGPHLAKCLWWTDCSGVMNGWLRPSRDAEETISAMLISPLLLHPPSILHPPPLPSRLPVNQSFSFLIPSAGPVRCSCCLFAASHFPSLNEFAPRCHWY